MIMNISIDMLRGSASVGDGDDNVALRGDKHPTEAEARTGVEGEG